MKLYKQRKGVKVGQSKEIQGSGYISKQIWSSIQLDFVLVSFFHSRNWKVSRVVAIFWNCLNWNRLEIDMQDQQILIKYYNSCESMLRKYDEWLICMNHLHLHNIAYLLSFPKETTLNGNSSLIIIDLFIIFYPCFYWYPDWSYSDLFYSGILYIYVANHMQKHLPKNILKSYF